MAKLHDGDGNTLKLFVIETQDGGKWESRPKEELSIPHGTSRS